MLLSKKTSIKVSREYANLIGHMCYAASKLWNVCNYERQHYKEMLMSQSGYQRFFQRSNGASPLVFLHIKKRHGTAFAAPCPFPFLRKKRAAEVSAARPSPFHFSMR